MVLDGVEDGGVERLVLLVDDPVLSSDFVRAVLHRVESVVLSFGILALRVLVLNER